ncbi:hypothetical protein [Desulfurococcus amylolyticus]|uniref:Uncharacterized protein n=1 Tax=Desulfurococcus amylolyticus DSM 16532 TaxID=768672 RepID=I3XRK4_DESAM|nr:hypothetical protein [Desulfurococcus amylolyticus]AFL66578.1 hypothetical protein Desfe_0679 [Desulfurococcus amylolyticus DSM 16532]
MVVDSVEKLRELLSRGWKPYYHKAVKRWYLRPPSGPERVVVDRVLEPLVEKIYEEIKSSRKVIRAGDIQAARASGATIQQIVEEFKVPRSTVYIALEKAPDGVVKPVIFLL